MIGVLFLYAAMAGAGQAYVDGLRDAGQAHVWTARPRAPRTARAKAEASAQKAAQRKNQRRYYNKLSKGCRQMDVRAGLQAQH